MPTSITPIPLGTPIPKHCKKLNNPKIAPAAAPPLGPIAIALIATGITFKEMDKGPIGMVPMGVKAKIKSIAVISAKIARFFVFVSFFMIPPCYCSLWDTIRCWPGRPGINLKK